jgi:hypothetical protein
MTRLTSFQNGTQRVNLRVDIRAQNAIYARPRTAHHSYIERILRYRRISGTKETNIEIIPNEAIANINFFIRFTSHQLKIGQRKSKPSRFDANPAKFIAVYRQIFAP